MNFSHCKSISSTGLGLGNETFDVRFFLSSTDSNLGLNLVRDSGLINSNLGLISHRSVREMNRVQVHSVINYVPQPDFPLSEVTTVTEIVKTTRFLTSTSTMERMFRTSDVCIQAQVPDVRNQPNQFKNMNLLRSEDPSMKQKALNILNRINVHSNVKRETVTGSALDYSHENPSYNQGLSNFDQTALILQNLDNPSTQRNQPSFHSSFKEVSDENREDYEYTIGYDGRTHSLPGYPEGVYGCPKCLATFYSSQSFATHIQTHYKHEGEEERRRRMAAKCRRRNLRLLQSSHGLTAMPESSMEIAKGYTMRRKNEIAVKVEDVNRVRKRLGSNTPPGAAMKDPLLSVLIKEEPM